MPKPPKDLFGPDPDVARFEAELEELVVKYNAEIEQYAAELLGHLASASWGPHPPTPKKKR